MNNFINRVRTIYHNDEDDNTTINDDNSADENLSFALNCIDEGKSLKEDVVSLCRKFIEDVQYRMQDFDIQYLTGLQCIWPQLGIRNNFTYPRIIY